MWSIGYFVIRTILTSVTFRLGFSLLPADVETAALSFKSEDAIPKQIFSQSK